MKKVSGTLKLAYSQYRELQAFAQFGSDLDSDTKARLAQGERIVEVLKQDKNSPVPVYKQVVIIYAVVNNLLEDVDVHAIGEFEQELYSYIDSNYPRIADSINETGAFSDETEALIKKAVSECKEKFSAAK